MFQLSEKLPVCAAIWKSEFFIDYFMELHDTIFSIKRSVRGGGRIDYKVAGSLALMVDRGNDEIVKGLLAAGISPEGNSKSKNKQRYLSPLQGAISEGYDDIAQRFLEAGATVWRTASTSEVGGSLVFDKQILPAPCPKANLGCMAQKR